MGICMSNRRWEQIAAPDFDFEGNHFDEEESHLLYEQFIQFAKRSLGKLRLQRVGIHPDPSFQGLFPWFNENQDLLVRFFHLFTKDSAVDFKEYARTCSIIARGTPHEKVSLACRIVDANQDNMISRDEVIDFINQINHVLEANGMEPHDAECVAALIFSPHHEHEAQNKKILQGVNQMQHVEKTDTDESKDVIDPDEVDEPKDYSVMTYDQFLRAAEHVPEVATCFGLFSLIYSTKIKPIIDEAVCDETREGLLVSPVWGARKVLVAGGFMVFFDQEDIERKKPLDIFILEEGNVRPNAKDHTSFFVITPKTGRMFKASNEQDAKSWMKTIRMNCEPTVPNRYNAFSKVYEKAGAQWFIDGREYFESLVRDLKKAEKSIMITGWHLSDKYYLTRTEGGYADRLDEILLERANAGVQIWVLIWDEVNAAFPLHSFQASKDLNDLNKQITHPDGKIRVIRDPSGTLDIFHLWSHHQKTVMIDQMIGYCGGIDVAFNRWEDYHHYTLVDEDIKWFPGLDYVNPMTPKTIYGGDPLNEYMDRQVYPRMPWHDIHCKIVGKPVRELVKNFIQRWEVSRANSVDIIVPEKIIPTPDDEHVHYNNCEVQVLRSATDWSLGLNLTEHSMYLAQLDHVKKAKHFIYIENQFFISAIDKKLDNPSNVLLRAIIDRIVVAHRRKEKFKVIVVMPIQPSSKMTALFSRRVLYWELACSYNGVHSFVKALEDRGIDNVDDYINIFSLRNYGRMKSGKIVTEMVYVHCKMMIVDDDVAFISSHNVNDRSLLGGRDSEIGAIVQDYDKVNAKMAGQQVTCGKFARDLRLKLWRIHLGLDLEGSEDSLIEDPVAAYDSIWRKQAAENTAIYLKVFKKLHDNIEYLSELKYVADYEFDKKFYVPESDEEYAELQKTKGFLVEFPRNFLKKSWNNPRVESNIDSLFV